MSSQMHHTTSAGERQPSKLDAPANLTNLHGREDRAGGALSGLVDDALRTPGQPLDADTRALMGQHFAQDFSNVPAHEAASANPVRQVNRPVNHPGDGYEQQARRNAEQVMAPAASPAAMIQAEHSNAFRQVRVHTSPQAAASARALSARAYTVGSHIVFNEGQYAPSSLHGRRLLAHELTHVAQQSRGAGAGLIMRDGPEPKKKTIDFGKEAKKQGAPAAQKGAAQAGQKADEKTLFFQDPKIAGDPSQPERRRVFVENALSTVGSVTVRFAYPMSELTPAGNPSKTVTDAKAQILHLIAEVIKDLGTFKYSSAEEEKRIMQERARLGEALHGFSASKPLNIFIATLDSPAELLSGEHIPYTDRVYINAKDVGDKSKLEAAIRLPLQNLKGGISAKTGQQTAPQSAAELKKTILHESLHVMLINKGIDSEAEWNKLKSSGKFKINGPANAQAKGEEFVRKFLIAQEEVFVYESAGRLYPPVSRVKGIFDIFIKNAALLLKKKGSKFTKATHSISVSEKVDKKAVTWSISYEVPGSFTLTAADIAAIDLILKVYPNQY